MKTSFLISEVCALDKSTNCLQTSLTSTRFGIKMGRCRIPRRGLFGDLECDD